MFILCAKIVSGIWLHLSLIHSPLMRRLLLSGSHRDIRLCQWARILPNLDSLFPPDRKYRMNLLSGPVNNERIRLPAILLQKAVAGFFELPMMVLSWKVRCSPVSDWIVNLPFLTRTAVPCGFWWLLLMTQCSLGWVSDRSYSWLNKITGFLIASCDYTITMFCE